jgi:predicted O-methyltransferase YrrM
MSRPNGGGKIDGSKVADFRTAMRRWVEYTTTGRVAYKAYLLASEYPRQLVTRPIDALRFLLFDPEFTNFTYEIANHGELSRFVAHLFDFDEAVVQRYSDEIRTDAALAERLQRKLSTRRNRRRIPIFGRRVGWYCVVRVRRPKLVVETGVADGLGSALLLRAIQRNAREGHPGHVVGIDIDPDAGWLLDDEMRAKHELILGDSLSVLPAAIANRQVDLFIHDSDHRYQHEFREYQLVHPHLSPDAVILSDNAHIVPALRDFAAAEGWRYSFFGERPLAHFYDGAGIGAAVRPLT